MKKIFISALFFFLIINTLLFSANFYPLPDTGQTKCYDNSKEIPCPNPGEDFYGQDANYSINPPKYTVKEIKGDKVVIDENTHLMWMQGTADVNGDGNLTADDTVYWNTAVNYCQNLTYAGYSDWRLPTLFELSTIVNYGTYNPAIDKTFFEFQSSHYWSSTISANIPGGAWFINFYDGYDGWCSKSSHYYVRCVRGEILKQGPYIDNNNGTVTDRSTCLIWQKSSDVVKRTWEEALKYCQDLNLAGYTDWRLPNIQELRSIVNYDKYNPAIDKTIFDYSFYYWASTANVEHTNGAWSISLYNGFVNWAYKSYNYYVRCVHSGLSSSSDNGTSAKCDILHLYYCLTENECIGVGGYWYDNKCNSNPQENCDINHLNLCNTESKCNSISKYWYNNKCNLEPECTVNNLSACNTQTKCEEIGKYWYNDKCNAEPYVEENKLPIIDSFTSNVTTGNAPLTVTFECKSHDLDGTIIQEIVYFGNGLMGEPDGDGKIEYTYENVGNFTAKYKVVDNEGGVSTKELTITVKELLLDCDLEHLNLCESESDCKSAGGYWWSSEECKSTEEIIEIECSIDNLAACNTQTKCEEIGKYWYNNKCNVNPQQSYSAGELQIKSGWDLVALPVDVSVNVEVFNKSEISTLWKWENGSWSIWSPNNSIMNIVSSYGLAVIDKIASGEGFWINASGNISVSVGEGDEYGIEKISIKSGWNLVGVGKEISSESFNEFGAIKTLWKWSGNNWKIWSPNKNIMNLINNYGFTLIDKIEKGEGFWINK